jgi:hypothetical protein
MFRPVELHSDLIPDEVAFERMKSNLLEQIDAGALGSRRHPVSSTVVNRMPSKRRTGRRWATVMAAAAAAVTVTFVAGSMVGPSAATAEAAEILRTAAAATIVASDPAVGTGEYLAVRRTEVALAYGTDYAYEDNQQQATYIPADKTGRWVESRQTLPPGEIFGNTANAQDEIDRLWRDDGRGATKLYEGQGGFFPTMIDGDAPSVPDLPDDAQQVVEFFYSARAGQDSADEAVFTDMTDLLSTGLVPAPDRSLLYEALALVPGVYLTDGVVNLDGRSGVAISFDTQGGDFTDQFIVDPQTGLIIGKRSLVNHAEAFVPAGTVVYLTSVETEVVTQVPTGPYLVPTDAG